MPRKRKSHPDEPIVKDSQEERETWRLLELIPDTVAYTAYQRLAVLQTYHVTGSLRKTSQITGISEKTIGTWRRKSSWWQPAIQELRILKDDEVDAKLTGLIDKAIAVANDRLENGDVVLDKDGKLTRKPVSLRDAMIAGIGVAYDKRALGRGLPTSRTEHVSDSQKLEKLAAQFKAIASNKPVEKIIEGTSEVIKEK